MRQNLKQHQQLVNLANLILDTPKIPKTMGAIDQLLADLTYTVLCPNDGGSVLRLKELDIPELLVDKTEEEAKTQISSKKKNTTKEGDK